MSAVKHDNKYGKIIVLIFSLILTLLASGCGKEEEKEVESADNGSVVFQYGDNIVTKGEVYIYVRTLKERYESQYGEDVWELYIPESVGDEEITMVDLTKQQVVEEIVKVKTLVAQADDYSVSLTEEEQAKLEEAANEFYDGLTDDDIEAMELNEEKILRVMTENEIANRVEEKLLEDNPIEISDEQARMTTFYDMYFNCYTIDENGVVTPFTEEEKAIQYENALSACSTLATATIDENKDAENIANLAEYYKLTQAKEYTLSPEEILETYGENVYNLLYSMEDGNYSTVIESEYGYHVFQMIARTDQKATQNRKQVMTETAINEQLADNLSTWQKEIDPDFSYPESINMNVYDTIKIK